MFMTVFAVLGVEYKGDLLVEDAFPEEEIAAK